MDSLSSMYPVLMENNNFVQIYGYSHLMHIEKYFKDKDHEHGDKAIVAFEKLFESYPIVDFPDNLIGRAYSEAAVYYFKKGQNKKCMSLLNRGLELAPNSTEIKSRLMMLN